MEASPSVANSAPRSVIRWKVGFVSRNTAMTRINITAEQASRLLPRGKKIHAFIRVFGWLGGNMDRAKILAAFHAAAQIEIAPDAAMFDHYLAVDLDGARTYIDTDTKALRRLFPNLAIL